jgi:hypothetical protein
MSLSNSLDQNSLNVNVTKTLISKNSTTVSQDFLSLALEYQKLKSALENLAEQKEIDLKTSYLILETTKKNGSKYELQFVVKGSNKPIIFETFETNDATFYLFKETLNAALKKARFITEDRKSSRASLPSLNIERLEVIDAASWGTAIAALIEFSNNDEPISSLTTTLQIQAYYGLFQSGITLGQGIFQITQVVSDLAGNQIISLSEKIGNKILDAAAQATGPTQKALSAMGKIASNSLTVATGIISLGLEIAAIAQLNPGDPQFASSATSLSFSIISFGLGLTSILAGPVVSSFAGALAVPIAGLGIGLGALIQLTGKQWENCRRLGEYTIELEKSYLNFLVNSNQGKQINLVDGYVIVKEVNLKTRTVQLDTPWLPKFNPPSRGTTFSVSTHTEGDSWDKNYKRYTNRDLPLTKTFNVRQEVILPVLPRYKMHIEKIGVATYYPRKDAEIMALPMLSGAYKLSWGFFGTGYIIGYTNRQEGPIQYCETTVKVIGSDGDDILISPSLKEEDAQDNRFIIAIRNFLTYEIHKSQGSCLLVVSKYAKYQITLGEQASLLLNLSEVDDFHVDYENHQIRFGSNWVKIAFSEQSVAKVILIDKEGKCKKVHFSTQSSELIWIDSELYYKAKNKSIEDELINRRIDDPLLTSPTTIPIKNAAKDYRQPKPYTRCHYGFYFRNQNVIKYLDSPGKLPERLSVVKCLPDQVILSQKVSGDEFYYYTKKDNGSFQIEFSGQPHSQSLAYLINGQLPTVYEEGRLENGCPNCDSGNIHYLPTGLPNYVKPSYCKDCAHCFPRYPLDKPDIKLSEYEKESIHSLLEDWSRGSRVLHQYIQLVIQLSTGSNSAGEKEIREKSQLVVEELSRSEKKLNDLKGIYSRLEAPEKIYIRELLRTPIANLLENPTTPTTPISALNPREKQRIDNLLREWAGTDQQLKEYLDFVISPSPVPPLNEDRILVFSNSISKKLEREPQKLNDLINLYMCLPSSAEKLYVQSLLRPPIADLLSPSGPRPPRSV